MSTPGGTPRVHRAVWLIGSVAGILVLVAPLPRAQRAERRSAEATITDVPPVIDGSLEDAVWATASPIGELLQVEPLEGVAPSEASDIRILFDEDNLYLGLRLYDRDPSTIIATTRERDARLRADDHVQIVLDTFLDRRNAYWFQMNATGSKSDALITDNGQDFNKPWDGIWEGKSRIDELGWTVEMAIPFKTLNFEEGLETWGLNVSRHIGRTNEEARWSGADQDFRFFNIFEAGDLHGLRGLTQGIGLDVVPFFVADWINDRVGDNKTLQGDPGLDAFYNITPSLILSLTINTDFAETEVDERQINLTRFPLFFPERRDFFLRDAGIFEFADLGPGFGRGSDLIPFFSRTIGLSGTGEEVPILAGAKLTGRADRYNIGVLNAQIDDFEDQESESLFVARVSRNVGEQSTVGGIFTRGDPNVPAENVLYGFDANFRTSSFRDRKNLNASVWFLDTHTESQSGDDLAYGASVGYPNDRWRWELAFKEIQRNFNPGLGFVPRQNIRKYDGEIAFRPRIDETIRQLEFSVETVVFTDTDDELETWEVQVQPLGIEWDSGDELRFETEFVHDELDQDFEIFEGVIIPADEYDYQRFKIEFESAEKRVVSLGLTFEFGDFFDGDRIDYMAELAWRPGPLFGASAEYEQNDVDLEGGDFTTQIARLRYRFSFTPDLSWSSFVQWDSVSETVGINTRLRWIPEPGREVFLVFNQTLDEAGEGVAPLFQQLIFKISYTIRL